MHLNAWGKIARDEWFKTAAIRRYAALHPDENAAASLGAIVRAFKAAVARHINDIRNSPGAPIWQRNYYEHVIRNERALTAIRQYILNNPLQWHTGRYYPHRSGDDSGQEAP